MRAEFERSAESVIGAALAAVFDPPEPITPSQWAAKNFVLADGEYAGQLIDLARTPYLAEPLDMLGPDSPVNEVAVMKSAQSGFSTLMLAAVGHTIDCDPADCLIVVPTDAALQDMNSQKLSRVIDNSPALRRKVAKQTARSGEASTTYTKRYGSFALYLAISNSAADLSAKTIKRAYLDELDRMPHDVDGQGSPVQLVAGRQTMFLSSGSWKRLYVSTPTIDGESEIQKRYLAGDQRRWTVPCAACGAEFIIEFDCLHFNKEYPYNAHVVAPCCGAVIEAWQKHDLVKQGRWVATVPEPGRYPSYHFDALSSPFVPLDEIAKQFIEAGQAAEKIKPFMNLVLGLPYVPRTDAPEYVQLMNRREDYRRSHVPERVALITIAADVQMRGIYYEVVGWASNRESWVIEADYLDGATDAVDEGAFQLLSDLYFRMWPDAFGNDRRPDEFAIDSAFRTHIVYEFCRRHGGTKAVKGLDGWNIPALGVATDQDISYATGRRIKGGVKLRGVGTWQLKETIYNNLSLTPTSNGGKLVYPNGYCHFGAWLDDNYFKQLVAEHTEIKIRGGRPMRVWEQHYKDNHFLDCRVYNSAMASIYFSRMTEGAWARREREYRRDLAPPAVSEPVTQESQPDAVAPPAGMIEVSQPAARPMSALQVNPLEPDFGDFFRNLADLNRGVF
jgi:phage terminase large subunit GpA-like protein